MAEDLACGYLTRNGHTVVARNWRSGHLEVDIVSIDAAGIHFVEVKSRVAPVQAGPEENVGYRKQKRLAAAARAFLHFEENKPHFAQKEVFFDVFSVIFEGEKAETKYYPQAYIPINF
ncbi:MAG: YraN family protein [Bacteroidales bacterium]|nr:YraN family protein [Bacteroidales bacterium]